MQRFLSWILDHIVIDAGREDGACYKYAGSLPISEMAERYLFHGLDNLERYLPFWAATMITRFKVMLVRFLMLQCLPCEL